MKRLVAGILLGLSLELGCSGAAYAEAPEIAAEFFRYDLKVIVFTQTD